MRRITLLLSLCITFIFTGCVSIQTSGFSGLGKSKVYTSDKDVLMMLVDGSGSMSEKDRNSVVKMDAAKAIIKDIALKLDPAKVNAGLLSFYSGCNDTQLLVEPNNNDFSQLISQSNNIRPSGRTPLASSIKVAGNIMQNIDKNIHMIIISDGVETCGGNPIDEVNRLKSIYGDRINTYVIGYAVSTDASEQLKNLVIGNGAYFDAKDGYRLGYILEQITNKLKINSKYWSNGVFNFKINFDSGSSVVQQKYDKQILNLADYLKKNDYSVEIQGHTDSNADEAYNQALSEKRANAVRNVLLQKGVSENRVYSIGYGELVPIDTNKTSKGRYNNRRVEAHIIKENGLNIDLINKSNYKKPIDVKAAGTNSFVGYYKMLDTRRTYSQYHAYYKIYANNQAYTAEYLDNENPSIQKDMYWFYDKSTKELTLDWTNKGKYRAGKFAGIIHGNTNSFEMSGHWNDGSRGDIKIIRISKEELVCMEDGGEFVNGFCTNYRKNNTSSFGLIGNLLKGFFN